MLQFRLRSDQPSSCGFRSSPKNQEEEKTSSVVPASENSSVRTRLGQIFLHKNDVIRPHRSRVPRLGTKPKGAVRRPAGFGRAPDESEQAFGNADDDATLPRRRSAADVYDTVQTFEEAREVRCCATQKNSWRQHDAIRSKSNEDFVRTLKGDLFKRERATFPRRYIGFRSRTCRRDAGSRP